MDQKTFNALYHLNKTAKQYASRAAERYEYGDGAGARLDSVRKSALYDYKTAILHDLYDEGYVDRVERHTIDGREYYCLYLAEPGGSFHTPVDDWNRDVVPIAETVLEDFDSMPLPEEESDALTERETLVHLEAVFGSSANEFLGQEWIEYWRWEYTGWDYLGDAKAIGDRIDNPGDGEYPEWFHFAVGDRLRTVERGPIRIEDRYGVRVRSSLTGVPVVEARYDVVFEDDAPSESADSSSTAPDSRHIEGVAPDELFWLRVLVDDPNALDEAFDGELAEILLPHEIAFDRGDVLVLDTRREDTPERALVHEFAVWDSLIDCQLEFLDHAESTSGGRDADVLEWMAVHDFENDIIRVESQR